MTRLAAALFSVLLVVAAEPAHAGDFAAAALAAEDLVDTDAPAAAEAARTAYADFNAELPFDVVYSAFVSKPAEGYGMYTERPSTFRPGEPLLVYCEPIGIDWKEGGRGFQSAFTVDFEIADSGGKVLGGQKQFGDFKFDSAVRNQEIMVNLSLDVDGAEAGDYVLTYTFTDRNSGESVDLDMPFTIAP